MDKQKIQEVIEESYQQACYYFKIIAVKKVIFKGFYAHKKNYQEIYGKQEILDDLGITEDQKKHFLQELRILELTKSGIAFPVNQEVWIFLNPVYEKLESAEKLVFDFVETLINQITHAVIFNLDVWWGHNHPYWEIRKYLKELFWHGYDWEKIIISYGNESRKEQ